jgi:phosphoribosyl-ATP pyrophosphohydrolase
MFRKFYQRQTEGQLKFIGDLFKRYASKTKSQFEASKKGMFDKMGVEAVENLHSKKESSLIELLQTVVDRFFFVCVLYRWAI